MSQPTDQLPEDGATLCSACGRRTEPTLDERIANARTAWRAARDAEEVAYRHLSEAATELAALLDERNSRNVPNIANRTVPVEAWDETHPDHLEWVANNQGICPIKCEIHSPRTRDGKS